MRTLLVAANSFIVGWSLASLVHGAQGGGLLYAITMASGAVGVIVVART